MAEVKRYCRVGLAMEVWPEGAWIHHSDYTALEREVERLRKVEAAAIRASERLLSGSNGFHTGATLAEACGRKG